MKFFKYLREHKAPASAKTNQKPSLPRGLNEERQEAHEGKRVLAKFRARVAQLDTPRIQKLHYTEKLDFLSQAGRPLIGKLCLMTPPPNYIMNEADETTQGGEEDTRVAITPRGQAAARDEHRSSRAKVTEFSDHSRLNAREHGICIHKQSAPSSLNIV
jgi:hypothetical protein